MPDSTLFFHESQLGRLGEEKWGTMPTTEHCGSQMRGAQLHSCPTSANGAGTPLMHRPNSRNSQFCSESATRFASIVQMWLPLD